MASAARSIASAEVIGNAGDDERRRSVEHHDVAPRAGLAAQDGLDDDRVLRRRAAASAGRRARPRPSATASTVAADDAVRRHVVEHAGAIERQLVDAGAVDDERALDPEPLERPRRAARRSGRVRRRRRPADGAGRVRQRPEEVERGPDADLAARRAGVLIAGWKLGANRNAKPSSRRARSPTAAS